MTHNPLQENLDDLRKQLSTLARLAGERSTTMPAQLPAVLAELKQTCEQVRVHADELQGRVGTLRESEARKSAILDASFDAVMSIDPAGQVVEFNAAAEAMFGYRREKALGRALSDLIDPLHSKQQAFEGLARLRAVGADDAFGQRFDAVAKKSDGTELPVEVAPSPIGFGDLLLLTIYVRDPTSRKWSENDVRRYQRRLRALTAELLVTEERERRRLAVDLHDGLSQTIALARIKLAALRPALAGTRARLLDEIVGLIEHADRSARSISFELSPPVLHDLGLEPAVQWLVENIHSRYGIEVALRDDGQDKPTDEQTRVILFRSIRELLINAAKHAGARTVVVRLGRVDKRFSVEVEDDGVGMELGDGDDAGYGLFSIRERMKHVGGSMHIDSALGRGTKVGLRAPLGIGQYSKAGGTS